MGEIRVSEIGTMAVRTQRRFVAEVVACGVAVGLASLAFSVLRHDAPVAAVASMVPIVDGATGKVLDRLGQAPRAEIALERRSVNSIALFAPGLDFGPGLTAIMAQAERSASEARPVQVAAAPDISAGHRPPAAREVRTTFPRPILVAKAMPVTNGVPLPPQRPEAHDTQAVALSATDEAMAKQPSALFGWSLPAEVVPRGRKVLRHVASLGEAVLDQRKVLNEVVSLGDAVLGRLTP